MCVRQRERHCGGVYCVCLHLLMFLLTDRKYDELISLLCFWTEHLHTLTNARHKPGQFTPGPIRMTHGCHRNLLKDSQSEMSNSFNSHSLFINSVT